MKKDGSFPLAPLAPLPAPPASLALPPERVRELDRFAIQDLGIPGPVLMENASRAVAALAEAMAEPSARVLILAGRGNNGGDGMAAHRHLHPRTRLILFGEPSALRGDAALQWGILEKAGADPSWTTDPEEVINALALLGESDLVVDALFGTGLSRPVEGDFARIIEAVNQCPSRVLAVDTPSGLDGKTGEVLGTAVRADWTVTFAAPKSGFYRAKGPELCGKLYLASIGIPAKALESFLTRG